MNKALKYGMVTLAFISGFLLAFILWWMIIVNMDISENFEYEYYQENID